MPINMPGKKIRIAGVFLVLVICLLLFRNPILRGVGHFLIMEDELQKVPVAFVLSGGAYDRAPLAATLYNQGFTDTIICTGENIPNDLLALGLSITEGDITKRFVIENGVPEGNVVLLEQGTSTFEESQLILDYCKQHGITKVGVVSSKFHTRRISRVFNKKFKDSGIEVLIFGAGAISYDEEAWWKSEYGLINLNNEYIKIVYYWIKH